MAQEPANKKRKTEKQQKQSEEEEDDIKVAIKEWTTRLIEQRNATVKAKYDPEKENQDVLVARTLKSFGVKETSSVENAIAHIQKKQKEQETIELVHANQILPAQWEDYRATLQICATDYFKKNSMENNNFVALYFKSITFSILWNDVWIKYVDPANMKRFALLKGIANTLKNLDNPDGTDSVSGKKNNTEAKKAAEVINFSPEELTKVVTGIFDCLDKQTVNEKEIYEELKKQSEQHWNFHCWVLETIDTVKSALEFNKRLHIFIENDVRHEPTHKLTEMAKKMCAKLKSQYEILDGDTIKTLQKQCTTNQETHFKRFQEQLSKQEWKNTYRQLMITTSHLLVATRLQNKLAQVKKHNAVFLELVGVNESIQQLRINEEFILELQKKADALRDDFKEKQKALFTSALQHDVQRYISVVLAQCYAHTTEDGVDKDSILALLEKNAGEEENPLGNQIKQDINVKLAVDTQQDIMGKCLFMLRDKKKEIVKEVQKSELGHHYENPIVQETIDFFKKFETLLTVKHDQEISEQKDIQHKLMDTQKPPARSTLLKEELFQRWIPPVFAIAARSTLKETERYILSSEDKETLQRIRLLRSGKPPLDISVVTEMDAWLKACSPCTFAEITEMVLWISWERHQWKMLNFKVKLTTDS